MPGEMKEEPNPSYEEGLSDETIELFKQLGSDLKLYETTENSETIAQLDQAIAEEDKEKFIALLDQLAQSDLLEEGKVGQGKEEMHKALLETIEQIKAAPEIPWFVLNTFDSLQDIEPPKSNKEKLVPEVLTDQRGVEPLDAAEKNITLLRIQEKMSIAQDLTIEELQFIYHEAVSDVQYDADTEREIRRIRQQRRPELGNDVADVLECNEEDIAWGGIYLRPETKIYIGPLFRGIFKQFPNLEQIFTSFPEGRVRIDQLEIGGKSADELDTELNNHHIYQGMWTKDMIHSPDFQYLENPETIRTVRLTVRDLGFSDFPNFGQIEMRAAELGLELCPHEAAVYQRLEDTEQRIGKYTVATKPINGQGMGLRIFSLERDRAGLFIKDQWFSPSVENKLEAEYMFCLREKKDQA